MNAIVESPRSVVTDPFFQAVVEALKRNRLLFGVVFAVVMAAAIAVTLLTPKQYESKMKILVKNERPSPTISPDSSTNMPNTPEVGETRVNSEIELLRSLDILRQVIVKCGLARKDGQLNPVRPGSIVFDKALRKLQHDLAIEPIRKTDLIQMSYASQDPRLSVNVLETVAAAYLDEHLAVRGSAQTYTFFQDQSKLYQQRLLASRNQLLVFQSAHPVTIGEEQDFLLKQKFETETGLRETERNVAEETARVSFLQRQQASGTIARTVTTSTKATPIQQSVERLNTMVAELQNHRTEVLNKYKETDRMAVEADKEIADTKAALGDAKTYKTVEVTTDINPLYQTAASELARSSLNLAGLRVRESRLKKSLKEDDRRLIELEGTRAKLNELERDVKENTENVDRYTRKQEEAHIEDLLNAEKIANVAIVEKPSVSSIPVSPQPVLNIVIGLMIGLLAASAAVYAVEMIHPASFNGYSS